MKKPTFYVSEEMQNLRSSAQAVPNYGDAELNMPYSNVEIQDMKQPFPEAVMVQPVLAGRRRLGVFEEVGETNETFYAPVEAYEGKHRYDPSFEWEPKQEQRLVRKVSRR